MNFRLHSWLPTLLWVLLAVCAYCVGRWQPLAFKAKGNDVESKTKAAIRPESIWPGDGSTPGEEKTDSLKSYRANDGRISSARMKDAVAAVLANTDPVKKTADFLELLKSLTPANAEEALAAIVAAQGTPDTGRYLQLLAHAWGAIDPKAALAALAVIQGREGAMARGAALAAWAEADPNGAASGLFEISENPLIDKREKTQLTAGWLTGLDRRHPDIAHAAFMTLPEDEQADLLGVMTSLKLRQGVTWAADWALQLSKEDLRTGALETVGGAYLHQDLDAAAKWAETIASRPDAHEAVADIADEMANRDPHAASVWVAKLPAGDSQNHAFEDVFENWAKSDPVAASNNLTVMTPGPGRDYAIQAFSKIISRNDPLNALTWAGAITDAGQRADLQVEIARRWQSNSPAEAQAWIAVNLPADVQARANASAKR